MCDPNRVNLTQINQSSYYCMVTVTVPMQFIVHGCINQTGSIWPTKVNIVHLHCHSPYMYMQFKMWFKLGQVNPVQSILTNPHMIPNNPHLPDVTLISTCSRSSTTRLYKPWLTMTSARCKNSDHVESLHALCEVATMHKNCRPTIGSSKCHPKCMMKSSVIQQWSPSELLYILVKAGQYLKGPVMVHFKGHHVNDQGHNRGNCPCEVLGLCLSTKE